eukprot:5805156-Lingulodinium_polyedra.AAC.1
MAPTDDQPWMTGQGTTWAAPSRTRKEGSTARRPLPRTRPTSAPRGPARSAAAPTSARATSRTSTRRTTPLQRSRQT